MTLAARDPEFFDALRREERRRNLDANPCAHLGRALEAVGFAGRMCTRGIIEGIYRQHHTHRGLTIETSGIEHLAKSIRHYNETPERSMLDDMTPFHDEQLRTWETNLYERTRNTDRPLGAW